MAGVYLDGSCLVRFKMEASLISILWIPSFIDQFLAVKNSSLLCGSDQKHSYLDLQDNYLWGTRWISSLQMSSKHFVQLKLYFK